MGNGVDGAHGEAAARPVDQEARREPERATTPPHVMAAIPVPVALRLLHPVTLITVQVRKRKSFCFQEIVF